MKIVFSLLSASFIMIVLKMFLKVPDSIYRKFNVLLWTIDISVISEGQYLLTKFSILFLMIMSWKHLIFLGCNAVLFGFSITYCTIFCAIHPDCIIAWLFGSIFCMIIDFAIIEFLFPLLFAFLRTFSKKIKIKYNAFLIQLFYLHSLYI